jgi:hypothetical protein
MGPPHSDIRGRLSGGHATVGDAAGPQRRPLTPRQEAALRIGIMAVWLIVCVVLLANGSVTGGIRAATQGLPGNATFGYCQMDDACQAASTPTT